MKKVGCVSRRGDKEGGVCGRLGGVCARIEVRWNLQTVEYVKVTCFAKNRHRVFKLVKNHASTVVRNGNDCMLEEGTKMSSVSSGLKNGIVISKEDSQHSARKDYEVPGAV